MTIRVMTLEDLQTVLGWAEDEGWNPGLEDAEAFHAVGPQGFFIKEVDGETVAAVSVVNHDPDFAFLGLYLCKPLLRGQGHGSDVWRVGIAHAGTRSIGLDGVPEQQGNYARSGFVKYGGTIRYEGRVDADPDSRVRRVLPDEIETLITRDAKICGMTRTAFAAKWFGTSLKRQTMALTDGVEIAGYATFRRCRFGTKVGPLCATSQVDVEALLASNPFAKPSEPVFIDVQEPNSSLGELLKNRGFKQVFETARMFKGARPEASPPEFHAIATMELG